MSKKEVKFGEEGSYTTKIRFKCPIRGEVEQEVVVKRFTAQTAPENKSVDTTISQLLESEEIGDIE